MYFLKRKTFTLFLLILSVVVGGYTAVTISKEYYPEINVPVVVVQTVYPGAAAYDIEESVTEVLESVLIGGIDDVDEISSTSQEGFSSIAIQFLDSADISKALVDVKDKIDQKKGDLPDDASDPVVTRVSFSDQPIYTFALSTTQAYGNLYNLAESVSDRLESIPGISSVDVSGVPDRQVTLLLDQAKLIKFNLSPGEISRAIKSNKDVLPAGSVQINDRVYRIDYQSQPSNVDDLENILVKKGLAGEYIFVKDVLLSLEDGLDAESTISRIASSEDWSPQQAIIFNVRKQDGGDIISLTEKITGELDELVSSSNGDFALLKVFDAGEEINLNLSDLIWSGFQTIILVFVVMGLMVGFKESIIAALAVPMSFFLAFIGMQIFGQTINFITLFSLILVIGILIDSAIVVVEGIYDYTSEGDSLFEASKKTLQEFSKPIIAGVLTTISIFFPLTTLSGTLGQFIGGIPRVINIVLVVSVFVALIFIPVIAGLVYKLGIKEPARLTSARDRIFKSLQVWYESFITKILGSRKIKKRILFGLILLFISSFMLVGAGLIKGQFFPDDEVDKAYINISLEEGSILDQTSEAVSVAEAIIAEVDHIDAFTTTLGQESVFTGPGRTGAQYANIVINIDDKENGNSVNQELRKRFSGINSFSIQVLVPESGPPVGAPFQVKVTGDTWEDINVTAERIGALVTTFAETRNVESGVDAGVTDIRFTPKTDRLAEYGLTAFDLSYILRSYIYGINATTLSIGDDGDVDVVLKVGLNDGSLRHTDSNHVSLDTISNIEIQTPSGVVLLGYFIDQSIVQSASKATRKDGEKITTVTAYINEGFLPVDAVATFNDRVSEIEIEDGVTYEIAGSTEESDNASTELLSSLLFGLLLIVGVLMWQFGSFRDVLFIMSVIPLGLIGVLYGLFIFDLNLSFTAMLGFIALVGIVVNDSIILVDVMNKLRLRNPEMKKYDVVIKGASMRLRPVLLTTVTTVLGMIPLLFVSPLWKPFAFAVITGLSFATLLTLILIPIIYAKWSK